MKLAVIATLFASASAFSVNKADLGKVRFPIDAMDGEDSDLKIRIARHYRERFFG